MEISLKSKGPRFRIPACGRHGSWWLGHSCRVPRSSCFLCFFILVGMLSLTGCATTEDTSRLGKDITSAYNEFYEFKSDMNAKLLNITKEQESIRKQLISLSTAAENREDRMRTIDGKIAELDYQLQTYWKDVKAEIAIIKAGNIKSQTQSQQIQTQPQPEDVKYDIVYKEAFDAFQKGSFDDAITKFSDYIASYPNTPLVSNAYYWLGESYIGVKNYEKAIVNFQEVIDKYPKSDKASRALLSQAEAFGSVKDEKSSITILKKVIELYPNTEEAAIAERKLRNLNLR